MTIFSLYKDMRQEISGLVNSLILFLGFSPPVARKKKRGIFEKNKSEQPAGTVHEMQ